MNEIKSPDGYSHLCINKQIRLFMLCNALCDSFGFFLVILKYFIYFNQPIFLETLYFIFTLIMLFKITIYVLTKICIFKQNQLLSLPASPFPSTFFSVESFEELLTILMLLFHPSIFYPSSFNHHLLILTPLRLPSLLNFPFNLKLLLNPILQRINGIQNINLKESCWKIAFNHPQYFKYRMISIIIIVIFGLGNIVKDYEGEILRDIYEVVYFMMVSMSTVGYGDLFPTETVTRGLTVVCVMLGVFVASMMTSKILAESRLGLKEEREYYLLQKLELDGKAQKMIRELFVEQMDYSMGRKEGETIEEEEHLIDEEGSYNLEQEIQQIIRQSKYLESINPTRISFITNTANRQVQKIISLNLLNTYHSSLPKNFHNKVKRRQGHRYNQQFLSPY